MPQPRARTRIQQKNFEVILEAALEVFSNHGFRGATLDQIAEVAGLSKPNVLYYFPSKEAIHTALLRDLLAVWLQPLHDMDPGGDPLQEIMRYVRRKLEMSRDMPRESRLFANEVLQGAPRLQEMLGGDLASLVDEKAHVIKGWIAAGKLPEIHPKHLIFSIWALTQHYADFDTQVRSVLGPAEPDPYPQAEAFLTLMFTRLLQP